MARFHDSRFQGARLVCRLRRNTVAAPSVSGVPTGPAASLPAVKIIQSTLGAAQITREVSHELGEASDGLHRTGESVTKVTDKYFVMKSLTVEDMELSVRNCIWATQAHNEEALNKAFEVNFATTTMLSYHADIVDRGKRISSIFCKQVRRILWLCTYGFTNQ